MPDQPKIIFYMRDQVAGKNRQINPGDRIAKLPAKYTPQVDFVGVPKGKIKRVQITLDDTAFVEWREPYRFNGDTGLATIDDGDHLLAVTAYTDHDGKTPPYLSGKIRFSTGAAPVVDPPKPPDGEVITVTRRGLAGWLSYPADKVAGVLKSLGMVDYRVWFDPDINKTPSPDDFKRHYDAGTKLTVCFAWDRPYASDAISKWTDKAFASIGKYIDTWEIGNEPNLMKYFSGTDDDYIALLAASSKVLRGNKARVSGGSVSEKIDRLERLIKRGLLTYVDAVGFHPYGASALELAERLRQAKALIGSTPLEPTELNIHAANPNKWKSNAAAMFAAVNQTCHRAHYYRITPHGTFAGPQAVVDENYKPLQPYFDGVKAWAA